ncbi:MAG: TonB-dependent receptor [Prevotella sp.]|nr:TonB-dependent receptor [Prevotella sp.]
MYKPTFNMKRQVLVFRHFGNKGYSLFACLGREVVCSVLSVATLTYASAESVSTDPVVTDSASMTTAREMILEEVSITGSRAPLTKSQAARMVTVLERADIAQAPVQSINDLLKYAIGVDVRQRGPIGSQTDISIRGGTQDQIILLLNGINICDPQTGHNALDLPIDLSEIIRIEVLEGPAGRIYGTSSLVGAINIVTHPAAKTSSDITLEGGSFGYGRIGGRANIRSGRWNNQVSAGYSRSDGYSRAQSGTLNTDFSGSKAFYQGQYEDEDVRLHWHLGIADKGWGSSTFYASPKWQADDQYEHTTKLFSAIQGETKRGRLHFAPSIYWNQNRDRYEGYRGLPEKMKYNYNRTDVYGVNLSSYFDWTAGRTAFGAEIRNEDLVSGNLGEPLSQTHHIKGTDREYTLGVNRTNISGYLEHNLLLEHLTVSAGLVAVKNTWSNMNMTIYPGIDVSYRPNSHWTLHASYNTSLRMPSFTEMYYKLQGYAADPHLKPEEMRALEAGLTFHSSLFTFNSVVWHHHGRNMIDWIMDTSKGDEAVWESVNHAKINSTGFEISAKVNVQWSMFDVSYSYIHQDKKQEEGIVSQYALEYLRHKLVGNLRVPLSKNLSLGITARWQDRVGSYTDFNGDVQDYKPYFLTDARLTWQQPSWKVYIEANNLWDTTYHDYGLVEQPGRWIIGGISLSL